MLRCCAVVGALLSLATSADAKGTATTSRSIGTVRSTNPAAFHYRPYFFPLFYTHNGRSYSPGVTWSQTPGWTGNSTHGECGDGACACPVPRETSTNVWVWVQMRIGQTLCKSSCSGGSNVDVVSFEVDLFKAIASLTPCSPPTQVLMLRQCSVASESLVAGGLADDQLFSSSTCTVVGDEQSVHADARARKLQQTPIKVVQFVVGADNKTHGDVLHQYVRTAVSSGTFKTAYSIPNNPIVLMETQEGESHFPAWAVVLIVFGGLLCCALCFACIGVLSDLDCDDCCGGDSDNEGKAEPASEPYPRELAAMPQEAGAVGIPVPPPKSASPLPPADNDHGDPVNEREDSSILGTGGL
eukprot:TRINITY_DN6379_c0_g1_i5.p1 TRINITY_DN6379_c0_g1~~TRINITY_DN6379_c0_g1_i5.p1  ORF type:complete len:356 (+),score=81.08 TRINITY_DN6379_c0_g1_i5:85-1152(+)